MTKNRNFKLILLTVLTLILALAPASVAAVPPAPVPQGPPFVPGEILIQVQPGVVLPEQAAAAVGADVVRDIADGSIQVLALRDGGMGVLAAVSALQGTPGVVFAEPNWLRQLHEPNDPGYGLKWDLHNDGTLCDGTDCASTDADMDWQAAYDYLGSNFNGSAVVAVIDTGIDASHPDLKGKIVAGYDYLDGDSNPNDTYGHGTHVAGIALAETNNGEGTAGVGYSPNIKVMPLRVCDENGCPTDAIVSAIYHAANNGANVINLSLGGRFGSSSEETAINYAWGQGLVIAASSGNDGSRRVSYPAAFANCIAVGSSNWHDQLAGYSNQGSALDVVAPGGDMSSYHDPGGIYSTMPTYDVYLTTAYEYSQDYDQLQGTSMAAPQVSGLAALLFAVGVTDTDGNGQTNDEIRDIIESTADDLGATGWDRSFGWGRINVYNAVVAAGGGGGENQPPVAAFTPSCTGLSCTFDASDSSDLDGSIVSFAWDFGDGNMGSGETTSHTYAADSTYTVELTVTDNEGATGTTSQDVTVSAGGGGATMYVFDITMSSKTAGPNRSGIAVVTIKDTDGNLVEGATVSGTWSGDDSGLDSGVTGADGTVSLESGKARQANATFTFTVNNVIKSGYTYDSSLNNATSGTITVP
jgi:subtilisin family serine protease